MSKERRRPKPKRHAVAVTCVAIVVTGAVVAGAAVVLGEGPFLRIDHTGAAAAAAAPASSAPPAAPVSSMPAAASPASSPTPVPVPLALLSSTPVNGAKALPGNAPILLNFDATLASDTVLPAVSPVTDGSWTHPTPTSLEFTPATPFTPDAVVTVTVPASLAATNGGTLGADSTLTYTVADGSLLGLQQLLAQLHYLPVTFTPAIADAAADPAEAAFQPPAGDFAMRFPATPTELANLWIEGEMTPMTKGAVMAFENVHQLKVDGIAGNQVWTDLIADASTLKLDPLPYTWAWTTMTRPETLQIWSDGSFVFSSLANTGIPAAPTPHGSWPVFLRYRSQTMQGTNPDGSKYKDPGVPYISYFNGGDAIHGFIRGSYGSQQSLGCVELPYSSAAKVWALIDYGTVVTVT